MTLTIIIPHYAVGKMTAFTLAQLLKFEGDNYLKIVVVDNNPQDGSSKYLEPFKERMLYVPYPEDRLQSHGIAIDYCLELGYVDTEYFLCLENDAYPIWEFVSYYEEIIENGYDAAGSIMKLSGGTYLHPCAALYRKSVWEECKKYCDSMPYNYYPNMLMRDNFPLHAMIHHSLVEEFSENPMDWIELSSDYKDNTKQTMKDKLEYYRPTCGPFHNGMGGRQESVKTYGFRNGESDSPYILLNGKNQKIIGRAGYEPGQFLYYWLLATGKKIFEIPTRIKWMPGREGQQQEHSVTHSNIFHIWGVSSYTERPADGVEDIYAEKRDLPDKLYNSLPSNLKIH